jgi:putative peptide zinc metalloprotease protein
MASLTTLLFNANPLMRFDGYYIFTDLIEIQNLYGSGQQYLRYFFRRYFFGMAASLPDRPGVKRLTIKAYAWASLFWRVMVCVSLAIVASTLFHGAGLVLTAMAAITWFGLPVWRLVRYLVRGDAHGRPSLVRFCLMSTATSAVIIGLLCLPWPGGATAPGIVEYAPLEIIRTTSAGFVQQVPVRPGQPVRQGQVLAVLENDELLRELEELKLSIAQSVIKSRIFHRNRELAQYQVEHENRLSLLKKKAQLEDQVAEMTMRAPRAGRVIGRDLDILVGTYVEPGTMLMAIGVEENKEIRLSISEERIETFQKSVGRYPHLRIRGRSEPVRQGRLEKIGPRASAKVEHPALGAPAGGPLAVRQVARNQAEPRDDADLETEFVSPRFTGVVQLPLDVSLSLRAGELARARLMDRNDTVGRRVFETISHWVRQKLGNARSA